MKKHSLLYLLSALLISLACTTNTENLLGPEEEEEGDDPITQVSYASSVQPIFNNNCTSCHGSFGGVNLTSFSALMNSVGTNYGTRLVVAGDANASGLVDKIEPNPDHGARMPTNGTLTNTEIQTIRTWINQGANNN